MGASKKQPPAKPAAMKAKAQPKKTLEKPKVEPASPAKLKKKTPGEEGEGVSRKEISGFLTGLKYKAENPKDKNCATAQALLEAEIFKQLAMFDEWMCCIFLQVCFVLLDSPLPEVPCLGRRGQARAHRDLHEGRWNQKPLLGGLLLGVVRDKGDGDAGG